MTTFNNKSCSGTHITVNKFKQRSNIEVIWKGDNLILFSDSDNMMFLIRSSKLKMTLFVFISLWGDGRLANQRSWVMEGRSLISD